ncbi:hypothetical protein [Pseudoalteromonas sp. S558]|uniref:hypothetical protein n=1 Tax=Pseudoalteromonas sp. S558 TaxID=2066515 RepID=UPI00110AD385|nr:hypothetical protein [Pseudoalteromonas sp. S558]TMO09560.1 hypothetical protein CWB66_01490 [Pseudoalteromonas sp. S558]
MKALLPLLLITAPTLVFATDSTTEETCKIRDIASLSYMENIKSLEDVDVGTLYKEKTEQLLAFAKTHKLEDFKIVNQDASVSANCCGNYGSQLNMNYSVSYKPSYKAFTALHKHSGSGIVSTYRVGLESCEND